MPHSQPSAMMCRSPWPWRADCAQTGLQPLLFWSTRRSRPWSGGFARSLGKGCAAPVSGVSLQCRQQLREPCGEEGVVMGAAEITASRQPAAAGQRCGSPFDSRCSSPVVSESQRGDGFAGGGGTAVVVASGTPHRCVASGGRELLVLDRIALAPMRLVVSVRGRRGVVVGTNLWSRRGGVSWPHAS